MATDIKIDSGTEETCGPVILESHLYLTRFSGQVTLAGFLEVIVLIYYTPQWNLWRQCNNDSFCFMPLNDALAAFANFATIFPTLVLVLPVASVNVQATKVHWPVPTGVVTDAMSGFIGRTFLIVHRPL
ncbi:hypothetical protein DFH07DRAFT_949952 [Mycena maculata]|uniref:Uncharacterized protein n=1 Tax=Mycena maculata TaxID=230809 RepID=A0AAD7K908_9AGAR|nr:hypothetical protein DFH07DRAFT_949952 [Mycena maculata]